MNMEPNAITGEFMRASVQTTIYTYQNWTMTRIIYLLYVY